MERELRGVAAAPGIGVGVVRRLAVVDRSGEEVAPERRAAELERARGALEEAAEQLDALAQRLAADGRADDAEIVATGALLARDPSLEHALVPLVLEGARNAPDAILEATSAHAELLAALSDPMLAARADDVRSLGRRAALLAARPVADAAVEGRDEVLVADDLGPADVAELGDGVRAIVLAGGGTTTHAAIVARGLGLALVAGLGEAAFTLEPGELVIADGSAGIVVCSPARERADAARAAVDRAERARTRARALRDVPAETVDGRRVTVLANVAGVAELELALDAGAEGVGLLRTELGFLDARAWPTEEQHVHMLTPILQSLGRRPATVRVLDFGADKTPPFLAGDARRGVELLLGELDAFRAQLRAILRAAGDTQLRVLVPMISAPAELSAASAALAASARAVGAAVPALGPMIETPGAVAAAGELAALADYFSVGTNDLSAAVLGVDRFAPGSTMAYHPRVLGAIAATVRAGQRAGIPVEVCGEAASDPVCVPLLVGLGVDELSVAASRVGMVRTWIRELDSVEVAGLVDSALLASTPEEVRALVAPIASRLASVEGGDAVAQGLERERRVLAGGGQP